MSELLTKINNRYLLVNVVAHRARQISLEAEKSGDPLEEKSVSIAIDEIANDKLTAYLKNNNEFDHD
jgi:DNA-directed RNA polymerase subunit omega